MLGQALVSLARLKFLIYSPVMYTMGAYVGYRDGLAEFDIAPYLLRLMFVYTTHIVTHFFNEFYDRHTNALHVRASPWTGVLAALPPFSHLRPTCGVIVLLSWAYSAPPLALESRGRMLYRLVILSFVLPSMVKTGRKLAAIPWRTDS